jgi:lantibiotic modifying enzyme
MPTQWQPLQDRGKSSVALQLALEVAGRLREPANVEAAVIEAKLQSTQPKAPQWAPYSLAQGYAGLALLFGQLDRCFPDEGWDVIAHEHLEIAADGAATTTSLMPGAFSGLAGLTFVAGYLSRAGTRYQRLLSTLEQSLIGRLPPMLEELRGQRDGVPVNAFDLISGLSGIALHLLSRLPSPEIEHALKDVVRVLIELSREENGLLRMHSPARYVDEYMLQQFPNGNVNCGLAHGIPGPLGVLALARRAGIECDGLEEAIDRLAAWLVAHRLDDEWGINWPTAVGLHPPGHPAGPIAPTQDSPYGQAGWCYGSPGVARTLYLAGLALDNQEYCDLAIEAIEAVLRRPVEARHLDSPTFCHGVAGLLHIVLRFAHDTGRPSLKAGAATLADQLLGLYEGESLLGFRSLEFEGRRVDQPGLLDGAPSVALVLLGVGSATEPAWDRIFLLS